MCCQNNPCHKCDPGFKDFYQEKVKEAKLAVVAMAQQGWTISWQDLLDAEETWYEYCALRKDEKQEAQEPEASENWIKNPINSWE